MSEFPTSGEGQQTPTELDLAPIRRRWSRYGGMGNDRSADDYTDKGCRRLAESAFHDAPLLVAEVERLRSQLDDEREALTFRAEQYEGSVRMLTAQLDDARGKAARLEGENAEALRHVEKALDTYDGMKVSGTGMTKFDWGHVISDLRKTQRVLADPSSVAEFEALGTPGEDKK